MIYSKSVLRYFVIMIFFFVGLFQFYCFYVNASEVTPNEFRSNYDAVMKWVNFLIIISIFFKYGYNHIKNFIQSQKDEVKNQISILESKKTKVTSDLKKIEELAEKRKKQIKRLKERILYENEMKCKEIIEQANQQSIIMLRNAKTKSESRLLEARKKIKDEIVNIAISLAEDKLQNFIDSSYNENLVAEYTKNI